MNRPKATRLRLCLAIAAVAAFAAFMPAAANADFGSGTGVTVQFSDTTPGAHPDLTVTHTYGTAPSNYTGLPTSPSGCTLPAPPAPHPCADGFGKTGDDLKQWILETPAGFYGNPSAVPFAQRCSQAQMNSYVKGMPLPAAPPVFYPGSPCPASAQVGTATLTLGMDAAGATAAVLSGKIYVVQSADPLQEVPTTLFTVFTTNHPTYCPTGSGCITAALSKTQIAPVTGGTGPDYRLRSVSELIDRPDLSATQGQPDGTITGFIKGIQQTLWGDLNEASHLADRGGSGNLATAPFQTNPTKCGEWKSALYARTYGTAGAVGAETAVSTASQTETLEGTATPGGGDTDGTYAKFEAPSSNSDCDGPKPSLSQTTSGSVDNNTRGANPGLTVNISNPGSDDADKANKMVTTLPASITINAAALGNVCQASDLAADTCPAASQVGTADISSPILGSPQHGRVYMTQGVTKGLPYLSIWVNGPNDSPAGAFKFRLDATTKFVGPSANMIETTFDNLPQLPFDSFVVKVNGGDANNSLLLNRTCPTDGTAPADGPITFSTTGYTGATVNGSSATSLDPCYGINNPGKISKCQKVGKSSKFTPKGVIAQPNVANIQLLTGAKSTSLKSRAKDSKPSFSFKITLKKSKYKKNKTYYYAYKVTYKDGKVIKTKSNKFKTCK